MMSRQRACVLVVLALLTASSRDARAQIAPGWFGRWTLNLSKSTYVPGPPPYIRASYVIEPSTDGLPRAESRGVTVVYDMVYPRGGTTHWEWVGKFDGQPYALQGVDDYVTYAYRRIGDRTYDVEVRIDDRLAGVSRVTLSDDGRSITTATTGRDAIGRRVTTTTVYDRAGD